jgi:hypothetical protein
MFMQTSGTFSTDVAILVDAGGLVAAAGGIAKGFEWIDGALSPQGRTAVWIWLTNLPPRTAADNWSTASSDLVDRIFGRKPLSARFFFRSCLASLIAFVVVVLIYIRIHLECLDDIEHFGLALCLFAAASLIPDYLSLLISRAIVRLMAQRPNSIRIFALLALDAVLKVGLATCVIFIGSFVVLRIFQDPHPWAAALETLRSFYATFPPFSSANGLPILGVLFYSSFFTSIWVWFYVFGGFLVKGLVKTGKLWYVLAPFLDLQANPLKSIGRVIGATYLIVGVVFVVLIHIAKWS